MAVNNNILTKDGGGGVTIKKPNPVDLYGASSGSNKGTITPGVSGEENAGSVYDDAMAKALREQNYKSYFDTAIQQYNIKANSEKYLANELAAKGLGTQGYGSTMGAGIQNTALNMYGQNLDSYNKTEQEITLGNLERDEAAKAAQEQKQAEIDNQVVGFIQNAINYGAGEEAINNYLANYGYMEKGADGQYTYTDKWNSLSDESRAYISSVISGKDVMADPNANMPTYGTEFSYDKGTKIGYYAADGKLKNDKGQFNEENNYLKNSIDKGEVKPGTYVALVNGSGDRLYVYYGTDGKMYNMSHEEYYKNAKDDNAVYFKYTGSKGQLSGAQKGIYNNQ